MQLNSIPFGTETIMLKNKREKIIQGKKVVEWVTRKIPNCLVKNEQVTIFDENNKISKDVKVVIVPNDSDFVTPAQWSELDDNTKFTAQRGDKITANGVEFTAADVKININKDFPRTSHIKWSG